MPLILTRHGMLDSGTLKLDGYGRQYAERNFGECIGNAVHGGVPPISGFFADPVAALDGDPYQRCLETIRPLADSLRQTVNPTTETGLEAFFQISNHYTDPKLYGVLCLRFEDGIAAIRKELRLIEWSSPCAYKWFAILTRDFTKAGGWSWRSILTRQPADDPSCRP